MDGPRNDPAKRNRSDSETPASKAVTDTGNLKKGHNELLCRTDTDSQTLKNLQSPKETGSGGGGCAGGWGYGKAIKLGGCDDRCTTIDVIKFPE